MPRIRPLAALSVLCLAGGLFAAASPASAAITAQAQTTTATAKATSTVHSQVEVQPASYKTCPVQFTRFRIYDAKCDVLKPYLCFIGNEGNFKISPRYAANGCEFRVWIFTAENERGFGLCINPGKPTNGLKQIYRSFRVVHSKDECPS